MNSTQQNSFDTLVVGGGIAGLQSALDLADQGYKVAVIEKDASIGGKMIRLSKVFPTLDCASCITTPKMASAAHHDNITLFTRCNLNSLNSIEIKGSSSNNSQGKISTSSGSQDKTAPSSGCHGKGSSGVTASITQMPRYVDADKCIGCRKCEYVCPVYRPDPEQGGFSATKAISIPFSNAIPQLAVLEPEYCMLCGQCEKVCPTQAIDYFQKPETFTLSAKTAIIATGFEMTPLKNKVQYGCGEIPNVIDALQMERLLAPHGPFNRVLRPWDGMEPDSIAYIQCAGSRDKSMGVSYCSRVCCMYAIKQAMLLAGALPLADVTIYYMDIRAFGKGYEQFYQNAKAMGIEFIKGKVARIDGGDNGSAIVRFENQQDGTITENTHDLVVLSLGMTPGWNPNGICPVSTAEDRFITSIQPKMSPVLTTMEGVFVTGAAAGPKDIVDTITESGSAAMEAARYMTAKGQMANATSNGAAA
ncbi:4Fe-4S binding domain protein [Desulfamplus magnetovallimortis]|uniref:4Fe-4S binding domain protein n=1 Tax=Desulfamplus magnetovallimortis TaxID=1246637 RepID=A0A1W1H6H8_9BACT|nr:CoB--CoM heterodisulfide reductase iron-sulfur subunit A family protein [Desulfamplus magnetovallimortis]SLM28046.1 4Fe-4S binding domain protein [Desulfamplus magnetovallimortis]